MPEEGKNIKRYAKLNEKLLKMRSVIRIKNRANDEISSARAIVTGIVSIENDPNYKSIRQSYGKQTDYARALHKEVGVPFGKCGVEEIKRFENTRRMQNYKVMVISKENLNAIIYVGPEDREHTIYLYSHDLATSLGAFYERVMEIHSNPPIIYTMALIFLFIYIITGFTKSNGGEHYDEHSTRQLGGGGGGGGGANTGPRKEKKRSVDRTVIAAAAVPVACPQRTIEQTVS